MEKSLIILSLLIANSVESAKLKIHRCELSNGTISFQEKKCSNQNTIKPQKKPAIKSKTQSKSASISKVNSNETYKVVTPKQIKYSKLTDLNIDDNSTFVITDKVKSFNISMQGLKKWSLFKKVYNNKLLHVKFLDEKNGEEISLRIDFIFPDNKSFSNQELTELVYLVGSQYVKSSTEGAVIAENMSINNGNGIMATFTDKNNQEAYRYTTRGAVFKGKWLIQFTLLSTNLNSNSYQYAVHSLFNSIKITQ